MFLPPDLPPPGTLVPAALAAGVLFGQAAVHAPLAWGARDRRHAWMSVQTAFLGVWVLASAYPAQPAALLDPTLVFGRVALAGALAATTALFTQRAHLPERPPPLAPIVGGALGATALGAALTALWSGSHSPWITLGLVALLLLPATMAFPAQITRREPHHAWVIAAQVLLGLGLLVEIAITPAADPVAAPSFALYVTVLGFTAALGGAILAGTADRVLAQRAQVHVARTDTGTGARNLRAILEDGEREFARARRRDLPLSVAFIQPDATQALDATEASTGADPVLAELVRLISGAIRTEDVIGRYGDDRFALLMPDTTVEQGRLVAERVRAMVAAQARVGDPPQPVTVSVGLATRSASDPHLQSLFARADEALYQAMDGGRDRVAYAPAPPSAPDFPGQA